MKIRLFTYLFFVLTIAANAQNKLQKELKIDTDAENYGILPAGNLGLIMTYSTDGKERNTNDWHFQLYDTEFNKQWTKDLGIDDNFDLIKSVMTDKNVLHIFFSDTKHRNYYYVMLDIATKKLDHFTGSIPIKAATSYFEVMDDYAIFGGNADYTTGQTTLACCLAYTCIGPFLYDARRDHATLNYVDYNKKSSKPIIVNFREQTTLNDLTINNDKNEFTAVIERIDGRFKSSLHLLNYSEKGKESNRTAIKSGKDDVALLDGFSYDDNNTQYVLGTYASKSYSSGAEGLYFTSFEKKRQQKISYYSFSDLKEFWGDYSKRIEKRLEKKIQRRKKRGKTGISLKILPTKIELRGDELVYIGEAYYIDYRTESYYNSSTGRWETRRVFDGYVFTHGIVAGFELSGKMKWHHSYSIGKKIYTLHSITKVFNEQESGDLLLIYQFGNKMLTQVLSGNKLTEDKEVITILPDSQYEKFRTGTINLETWYDNFFISYGIMTVKDKDKKLGKRKETLFYFSKVAYQ